MTQPPEYKGPYSIQKILFWIGGILILIQLIKDPFELYEKFFPAPSQAEQESTLINYAKKMRAQQESVLHPGCIEGDCDEGEGTFVYLDGSLHKGLFLNSKPQGYGLFLFPLNKYSEIAYFIGDFSIGFPCGSGYIQYTDGSYYRGEINPQFQRNGEGTYVSHARSKAISGKWDNDQLISEN